MFFSQSNRQREGILLALAVVFVVVNAIAFSFVDAGALQWRYLTPTAVWLILSTLSFYLLGRSKPRHDPYLLPIVALLMGWGLVLLGRLAPNFLWRQTIWIAGGMAVFLAVAIVPNSLRPLRRYRYTLLFGGLALLGATLIFGVNPSGYGAALWLPLPSLGQVYFQPSELLKLLLVIFLASYFDEREGLLRIEGKRALPYIAPLLLMWGFCMALLVWQRDLGAATLFFILFLALLYVAADDKRYVFAGLGLLLASAIAAYFLFDVVALRVDAWWNPWPDADNRAFQIVQSLYAVADGGLIGQGIGQGFPDYIPVVHSDFVFAAVAEEWGMAGAMALTACFMIIAWRGFKIALSAKRPFRLYLSAGIATLFAVQALLIMGGVVKLLPLTGVTLPFISYGGSSLLISCVMLGLLFNNQQNGGDGVTAVAPSPLFVDHSPQLSNLLNTLLLAFLAIAAALLFWIARAPAILAREDNPRLVEDALRVRRGTIFDRYDAPLAVTVGEISAVDRFYPISAIGPAVGYYSFRHGTAGVEESMDAVLRGDSNDFWQNWRRDTLHDPQIGRDVRLSLDAALQQTAASLLGEREGAVILLELNGKTADILAMASHPAYDPNLLDAQFEELTNAADAPLLNRAAQGQYQPGLTVQPFLLAAALEADVIALDDVVENPNRPVPVNGVITHCAATPPDPATWRDVIAYQCPAPTADLGELLGVNGITAVFDQFRLTKDPIVPLNVETPPAAPLEDAALAAIGQDNLIVSPLQVAAAWAALAENGRLPFLQLVTDVENETGGWQTFLAGEGLASVTAVDAAAARAVFGAIPLETYSFRVASGPDGGANSWHMSAAPANAPRYAVVVVVENSANAAEAGAIGQALLEAALRE